MIKKEVQVQLENGLDARPVALLVQEASKYDSKVYILSEGKKINAKSIMGMMTLALINGESLEIAAEGEDEQDAVNAIEAFLGGKTK